MHSKTNLFFFNGGSPVAINSVVNITRPDGEGVLLKIEGAQAALDIYEGVVVYTPALTKFRSVGDLSSSKVVDGKIQFDYTTTQKNIVDSKSILYTELKAKRKLIEDGGIVYKSADSGERQIQTDASAQMVMSFLKNLADEEKGTANSTKWNNGRNRIRDKQNSMFPVTIAETQAISLHVYNHVISTVAAQGAHEDAIAALVDVANVITYDIDADIDGFAWPDNLAVVNP